MDGEDSELAVADSEQHYQGAVGARAGQRARGRDNERAAGRAGDSRGRWYHTSWAGTAGGRHGSRGGGELGREGEREGFLVGKYWELSSELFGLGALRGKQVPVACRIGVAWQARGA